MVNNSGKALEATLVLVVAVMAKVPAIVNSSLVLGLEYILSFEC